MSRSAKELAVRERYGPLDNYAKTNANSGNVVIRQKGRQNAQGVVGPDVTLPDAIAHDAHFTTPAFGQYHKDSQADEDLRDYYETIRAVETTIPAGAQAVQRIAPISDAEINSLKKRKEEQKLKKFHQYVMADAHPSRPWTMQTARKICPEALNMKVQAIESAADLAVRRSIIKHIGHGDDPANVMIQYMDDNNMLENEASLVHVQKPYYRPGPLSIFKIADPAGLADNTENKDGLYDDKKLYLSRASKFYDNHGMYVPTNTDGTAADSIRARWTGTLPRP